LKKLKLIFLLLILVAVNISLTDLIDSYLIHWHTWRGRGCAHWSTLASASCKVL